MDGLEELRAHAIGHSLPPPTTLGRAVERLGFVQADPIRAPARAHDLILAQRVRGYRAGDLEARYASLDVDEDTFYAYGFLARRVARLLHPRRLRALTALERRVLAIARERGVLHPRELAAELGDRLVVNPWGGLSRATTRALDRLHHRGYLRVVGRASGTRTYGVASEAPVVAAPERLRGLLRAVAHVLAPVPARTLSSIAAYLTARLPGRPAHRPAIAALVASGELTSAEVDGVRYLWPNAGRRAAVERRVRLLAPFDPVVWDRRRFEHLFGWAYRFEAYTPAARRVRGYYALPLLWCDRVVGWANAAQAGGQLEVEVGFAAGRPRERDFGRELDAEIERLREMVGRPAR